MKTNVLSMVFALIALALMSCEANKLISVRVIDKTTRQPIDSVYIEVKAGMNGDYHKSYRDGFTNANGKFETQMMIGCSFGCYDIYTVYSKKGYTDKTDFNKTECVVEMIRQ
ncbi:MAG: hypothetical protein WCQ95_04490 [Bacteroidota bacterium]